MPESRTLEQWMEELADLMAETYEPLADAGMFQLDGTRIVIRDGDKTYELRISDRSPGAQAPALGWDPAAIAGMGSWTGKP